MAQLLWMADGVSAPPSPPQKYRVGVAQIVEHTALDEVREGVIDVLREEKLWEQTELTYLNAQGNMVTLGQITKKLIGQKPDAIVAIGTAAAQAAVSRNQDVPVLFAPVTDPLGSKLVQELTRPAGVASGSSDLSPMLDQLRLIREILPRVQRVAILFNPGEANSLFLSREFSRACKELGLTPVEGPVQNTAMVLTTAKSLQADAIFVPTDNTVASAFEAAMKAGLENKTPVFAADLHLVRKGALAGLSVDYRELGRVTAHMLIDVLQKKARPAEMPVRYLERFKLAINRKHAAQWGVTFPAGLVERADLRFD